MLVSLVVRTEGVKWQQQVEVIPEEVDTQGLRGEPHHRVHIQLSFASEQ